jgi:hypothetical protein
VRLDKALAVLDGLGLALMVLPKEHPWAREAASHSSPSAPARDSKP